MKANELRIGNWVYAGTDEDENPLACKVDAINDWGINWGGNKTTIEYVKPIPISPEWLEKCGFDNGIGSHNLMLPDQGYLLWTGTKIEICYWGIYATAAPGEYLHQLQNLYFALTGSELNINLGPGNGYQNPELLTKD